MKLPDIVFTKWFRWSERNSIENSDLPGVYILAKFRSVPRGRANMKDEKIIYFGETCRPLKTRWNDFNRSAFQSKFGHSGGSTYKEIFNDMGKNLYVAALPIQELLGDLRPFFIRFVERKLIFDYALKHVKTPRLNLK